MFHASARPPATQPLLGFALAVRIPKSFRARNVFALGSWEGRNVHSRIRDGKRDEPVITLGVPGAIEQARMIDAQLHLKHQWNLLQKAGKRLA